MVDHIHALPEGYRLQEYSVTGCLGFGGFGITYSAHDTNLDMQVAIKEYLPSELAVRLEGSTVSAKSQQDKESFDWGLERFIDEGRAVARFNHPNIIRIHRFFEQNGTGYIVMELIEGNTLAELLDAAGTLSEQQIRDWLWPVMDGLRVVHASGFIHRDIKPQNIMMNSDGVPILLDFGAARLAVGGRTRSMTSIMTPGFAPLEQYQTRGQGPWTDVYALGAVMYKCISGKKPQDALDRVTNDQLEQPESGSQKLYSPGLLKGVSAALAVAAADRPQSIEAWLEILEGRDAGAGEVASRPEDAAEDEGSTRVMADAPKSRPTANAAGTATAAPPAPPGSGVNQESKRSGGTGKWVVAAIVLLVLGAGVYGWLGNQNPGSPAPVAVTAEPPVAMLDDSPVQNEALEVSGSAYGSGPNEASAPFQDCATCPVMVVVPAGRFLMGSPASEPGRAADEPAQHPVVIERAFAIGSHEVTVAEFTPFARQNDPGFAAGLAAMPATQPVTGISWEDAVAFTQWLSDETGHAYRLPTEAEWEYAARAGSETAYWWGDAIGANQAHCRGCGSLRDGQKPVPVGSLPANAFGLYEVHGNVSEWVDDCSNQSSSCPRRILKGGSYVDQPASARSAWRYVLSPKQSREYLGFRVARDL